MLLRRALATLAILALAGGWAATSARADGDPASDVLATQQLFVPQDAGLTTSQQLQLAGLLQESARDGFPVCVALIFSRADLGSVTPLWRQPASYAQFLGQELSLSYRGALLVVMPDGYGLYHYAGALSAARSVLAAARGELASATIAAVRGLAAAVGHPLALPTVSVKVPAGGGGGATPWIALLAGAVTVALAWGASLRARPLELRHRAAGPP